MADTAAVGMGVGTGLAGMGLRMVAGSGVAGMAAAGMAVGTAELNRCQMFCGMRI